MSEAPRVNWVEAFSSFQGEGPYVGASTLFVRLGGCDLRCRWCDSVHTWQPARRARIEPARGCGKFRELPADLSVTELLEALEALEPAQHRFVSLTGGEPLLQPEAVEALARALRTRGPRIHLESHGALPEALARVVGPIDVVAMDWKLASDVRRAHDASDARAEPFHDVHERFLQIAHGACEVFVKIVVTPASLDAEIDEACDRIAACDPDVPLILQPVTPRAAVRESPSAARMLALQRRCEARLREVRIIPQTHVFVGAL